MSEGPSAQFWRSLATITRARSEARKEMSMVSCIGHERTDGLNADGMVLEAAKTLIVLGAAKCAEREKQEWDRNWAFALDRAVAAERRRACSLADEAGALRTQLTDKRAECDELRDQLAAAERKLKAEVKR